jgi:hypothetical protein
MQLFILVVRSRLRRILSADATSTFGDRFDRLDATRICVYFSTRLWHESIDRLDQFRGLFTQWGT